MYPACRYIPSHIEFSITGTVTSCNTLGSGPSKGYKQKINKKPITYLLCFTLLFKKGGQPTILFLNEANGQLKEKKIKRNC